MTNNRGKNTAASVRDRLLSLARERGEDFQLLLTQYGLERLLYRLSQSDYRERFHRHWSRIRTSEQHGNQVEPGGDQILSTGEGGRGQNRRTDLGLYLNMVKYIIMFKVTGKGEPV